MNPIYSKTTGVKHERELLQDYVYRDIVVPKGFKWDGASTPRLFWFLVPPLDETEEGSCIHDFLCQKAKTPEERKEADKIFYQILCEKDLQPAIRRRLAYTGVRIGAWWGTGVRYPHKINKFKSWLSLRTQELNCNGYTPFTRTNQLAW